MVLPEKWRKHLLPITAAVVAAVVSGGVAAAVVSNESSQPQVLCPSGVPLVIYPGDPITYTCGDSAPTPLPTGTSTTPVPTATTTTPVPTATTTTTTTPPPTTTTPPVTTSPPTTGQPAVLNLPRIPWEGGPAYWSKFPQAQRWTDPSFFPIGIWYGGFSTDAEVQWDKNHGINFYTGGLWQDTDFNLLVRNNMYWIGGKYGPSVPTSSLNWPGTFMEDEVDGTSSTPAQGFAILQGIKDRNAGTGRFLYNNFTQLIVGSDLPLSAQLSYVNNYTDAISLDMYWYTTPFCDWRPYRGTLYADPVPQATCRTSSSYGRMVNSMAIRDATDGKLQPKWMFIENLNGLGGQAHVGYITPGQLKGAAMNSVINEARGLTYFNQSLTGNCQSGNVIRQAQIRGPSYCGATQIEAMGEVNRFIQSLATVINTQSYQWNFGTGLDTMLKVKDGSAYIFAMTDGGAGQRVLTLPAGINGTSVEVVGEGRTLAVSGGKITDNFANEYTYHVYKINL